MKPLLFEVHNHRFLSEDGFLLRFSASRVFVQVMPEVRIGVADCLKEQIESRQVLIVLKMLSPDVDVRYVRGQMRRPKCRQAALLFNHPG